MFGTYDNTFAEKHHLTVTGGMNMEDWSNKSVGALGKNLLSETLNDLNLVGPDETGNVITEVSGGQNTYAIMGFFGRINYDFKERYLFEVSGRYDGTSRFKKGHQWGFFPSASVGWRISEEPFVKDNARWLDNLKLRFSYGNLGNQNLGGNYYAYLRQISVNDFAGYSFGEGTTMSKYSTLGGPVDANLTWETAEQYNLGLDFAAFKNRLTSNSGIVIYLVFLHSSPHYLKKVEAKASTSLLYFCKLLIVHAVFLIELINTSTSSCSLLLACVEWMAL